MWHGFLTRDSDVQDKSSISTLPARVENVENPCHDELRPLQVTSAIQLDRKTWRFFRKGSSPSAYAHQKADDRTNWRPPSAGQLKRVTKKKLAPCRKDRRRHQRGARHAHD